MVSSNIKLVAATCLALSLTACGSGRMQDAEQKMESIRNEPAGEIEPIPQPEQVEEFSYNAGGQGVRSPFLPPSLVNIQVRVEENSGIAPDVNRPRDVLEEYDLAELVYRGRVVAPNGQEYGLIQLPDGTVRDVQKGEYMGKSDGEIREITPTQINIREIVPDANSGFVYKTTSLVTPN